VTLFISDRKFEVWHWGVGHDGLLLRSNPSNDGDARIEVLFKPAYAIGLPSHFTGLVVEDDKAGWLGALPLRSRLNEGVPESTPGGFGGHVEPVYAAPVPSTGRPPRLKAAGIIAAICVLILLVGFVVALVLHHAFSGGSQRSASAWASAIQATTAIVVAVATVVLVAVTARYVLLTGQLVKIQSDYQARARAQKWEDTAHAVASRLAGSMPHIEVALELFPLIPAVSPDPTLVKGADAFMELAQFLEESLISLPSDLQEGCKRTSRACRQAREAQTRLYMSMRHASMHRPSDVNGLPDREWTWEDAEEAYAVLYDVDEDEAIDLLPDELLPWWAVIDGEYVIDAVEEAAGFQRVVAEYLA